MHSYREMMRALVPTLVVIRMRCVKLIVIVLCVLPITIGVTNAGVIVGVAMRLIKEMERRLLDALHSIGICALVCRMKSGSSMRYILG